MEEVVDSWERWVRLVRKLILKLSEEAPATGHKDRVAWLDACFALGQLVAVLGGDDRVHALTYLDKCRAVLGGIGRLHIWRPLEARAEELLRVGTPWPEGLVLAPKPQAQTQVHEPQAQVHEVHEPQEAQPHPHPQPQEVEAVVVIGGEGVNEGAEKKTSRKPSKPPKP